MDSKIFIVDQGTQGQPSEEINKLLIYFRIVFLLA